MTENSEYSGANIATFATTKEQSMYYTTIKSPVGELKLVATDKGLAAILWPEDKRLSFEAARDDKHPTLCEAGRQLREYFSGKRKTFSVKLDATGTTFQKKVWQALAEIPFGQTRTYT